MVDSPHGFFASRRPLDIPRKPGGTDGRGRAASYRNVSKIIGILISRRLATLHELETVYGVEDAHNMLEIVLVDDANRN
jgi:hypothetical protein